MNEACMLKCKPQRLAHIINVGYSQSMDKYLLRAYCVPGTELVVGGTKVGEIKAGLPSWSSQPF